MTVAYRTGTVSVTNGSAVVTGTSTLWQTVGVLPGDLFTTDLNDFYEIASVDSETQITLNATKAWGGSTSSGLAYAVVRSPSSTTNAELANRVANLLNKWHNREDEMTDWLGGTATGGPQSDGLYPLTDVVGSVQNVKSPAKMQADVDSIVSQGSTYYQGLQDGSNEINIAKQDSVFWKGDPSKLLDVEQVYFFDTRNDSDGGAWRLRCGHTSWAKEAVPLGSFIGNYWGANSAVAAGGVVGDWFYDINALDFREITNDTVGSEAAVDRFRAGKAEFPEQIIVTISNNGFTIIIWDATLATPQMWMIFTVGTGNEKFISSSRGIVDISYSHGTLIFGGRNAYSDGRLHFVNFITDRAERILSKGHSVNNRRTIGDRNVVNAGSQIKGFTLPASSVCEVTGVAAYPGKKTNMQTGLPDVYVAVATYQGLDVIRSWDDIVNLSNTRHFGVDANERGEILAVTDDDGASTRTNPYIYVYNENLENPILISNSTHPGIASSGWGAITNAVWADRQILISSNSSETFQTLTDKLVRYILNRENDAASLAAWVTNEFNSGWVCGDVVGLWLCDSVDQGNLGVASNLCTNGQFGTDTSGWTGLDSATLAVDTGRLKITNGAASAGAAEYELTNLVVGKTYYVQVDYDVGTSASASLRVYPANNKGGSRVAGRNATSGTGTFYSGFVAVRETMHLVLENDAVNGSISYWDNVIIYDESVADRESGTPVPLWNDSGTVTVLKTTGEMLSFSGGVLTNNHTGVTAQVGDLFVMLLTNATGDLYITTAGDQYIYDYTGLTTENGWGIDINGSVGSKVLSFRKVSSGTRTTQVNVDVSETWETSGWKVLSFRKRGSVYSFEINGETIVSAVGDASLTAGTRFVVRTYAATKNLQISKTPPTDEQLKFMADELLGMLNNNVLIAGNASTPESPVKALQGEGALYVTDQSVSRFNGLIREGSSLEDEPELLVDGSDVWIGDFNQADGVLVSPYTAWSGVNATLSVQDKLLKVANSSGVTGHAERVFSGLTTGEYYMVHWDYHKGTAIGGQVSADGGTTLGFENITTDGPGEFQFKADGATVTIRLKNNDSNNGAYGFYNNVRLRKAKVGVPLHAAGNRDVEIIAGQHAVQVQKKQRRVRPEAPAIIVPKRRETFYIRDLVKNGDFPTNTDNWTAVDATLSIDTARLKVDNTTTNYGVAHQKMSVYPGRYYDINMNITNGTHTARVRISRSSYFGAEYADSTNITGAQNWQILATMRDLYIALSPNSNASGDDCLFDNVSVKQVDSAGNPYYSLPSGFRPVDILIDGVPAQNGYEATVVFDGFVYSIIPVTDFTTVMRVIAEEI